MWEYEPYNVLTHHGILGMKHKIRMGPPYPLPASAHSAAEKKAGWRKSLDGNSKMETAGVRVNKKLKKLQEEDKKKTEEEETKLEKESEQELDKETEKKTKKESKKKTKKESSNDNNTLESEKEKKSKKSDDSNNTLESVPDSEKSNITKTPSTSSGRSSGSSGSSSGSEPVVSGRNTKVESDAKEVEMEDMNGNKVGKSSSITKTNAVDGSEKEEISKESDDKEEVSKESESNQNESGSTKRKVVRVKSSTKKSSEISKQSDNTIKRFIKRKKR